jgi:FkbM family methyltransferase
MFPLYIPRIFSLCVNWHEYLFNYLSRGSRKGEYLLRSGIRLRDEMGDLPGTMAVVFVRREYGPVKRFRTIVDIGAHIGTFGIYAAQSCPEARIFCYEPEARNFELLNYNIRQNKLKGHITAYNSAVASTVGQRQLAVGHSLSNSFYIVPNGANHQSVQCTTLEDILEDHDLDSIDLLKMNCEGAEYEILETCSDDILRQIQNIRLEYHNLDSGERSGESLKRFLISKGYRIERFSRYLNTSGFIWAARIILLACLKDSFDFLL